MATPPSMVRVRDSQQKGESHAAPAVLGSLHRLLLALAWLGGFFGLSVSGAASAALDYRSLVDRIDKALGECVSLYEAGDPQGAKSKVQTAYFELFENLEGPIRVNVSARKSYELEAEFGEIRKMVLRGEPAEKVRSTVDNLMSELRVILPELEGGFQIVAEPPDGEEVPIEAAAVEEAVQAIEPYWQQVVDDIAARLEEASAAYKNGDTKAAKETILQAQFEGYKNTLLETAIRRHVSQGKDADNNARFGRLIAMADGGDSPDALAGSISALMYELRADLPGLPLLDQVKDKDTAAAPVPEQDWAQVAERVLGALEQAVSIYAEGGRPEAVGHVQDTYFDIFEGSGMEAKVAARDGAFKAELEGYFAKIVGQMKSGASTEAMRETLGAMKTDLDRAVGMLGSGADSPFALFIYSLLIMLREGFEAILIVTAIIAYLIKTENRDKLGVIYNSVFVALGLSVVTAVLVEWVFEASAASQEVLEGATMLIAAVVLFSMSYWLIAKAEAAKWMAYIKGKISGSLSSGSLAGLWFATFLAVYREGAETVLFYQALVVDADAAGNTAILAGFILGCAALVVIYFVMRYGAVRLPIRPFFLVTGAVLYYMAFVFAGKGMMELMAGKVFEPTLVSWMPEVAFAGLYPYWQTLIPQLLLVAAALGGLAALLRQRATVSSSAGS